jgi:hypothetical protein
MGNSPRSVVPAGLGFLGPAFNPALKRRANFRDTLDLKFVRYGIGGARRGEDTAALPFALRAHGIILPRAKKMSPLVRMKTKQ